MRRIKKIIVAVMAVATMATSAVGTMSASAANTSNYDFNINISSNTGTIRADTLNPKQMKLDSTSTYVNYTVTKNGTSSSGPSKFRVYVYGSSTENGTYVDCSSYKSDGTARPAAIVTKGTKGFVKQLVYENFGYGSYATLYGQRYKVGSTTYGYGTTTGCWSPDSEYESNTTQYN